MIDKFSPDEDFWKMNPQLRYMGPFAELYNKGKLRKKTSQIAWGGFLYAVTSDKSYLMRLPEDERLKIVKEEFKLDPVKDELHAMLVSYYREKVLTPAERQLKSYEEFLERRVTFITQQEYNFETMDALDKASALSKKIWDDFLKVKEEFDKEKDSRLQGGRTPSATESGVI